MPTSDKGDTGQLADGKQCFALVPWGHGTANQRHSASLSSDALARHTERTSNIPVPSSPVPTLSASHKSELDMTSLFRSDACGAKPVAGTGTGMGLFETDCEVPKCDQRVMRQPSKWFA